MSLSDLITGNYCPITGHKLYDPIYRDTTKMPNHSKKLEYGRKYFKEKREEINQRRKKKSNEPTA